MSTTGSSINDLKKQLASLTAELESRQKNIRHDLKAEFETRLAEADLAITDIYPELTKLAKGKKGGKAAGVTASGASPKYRNPNGSETWSGRGKPPRWVVDLMDANGLDIQSFKSDHRFKI